MAAEETKPGGSPHMFLELGDNKAHLLPVPSFNPPSRPREQLVVSNSILQIGKWRMREAE